MTDLATYLNDHLAGSIGALEMLDNLIETHEGTALNSFLVSTRDEIREDQGDLKRLMRDLGIEESTVRQAGAWLAEKFSRPKLQLGDKAAPNLALLQSLESLCLGIAGKRSLWRSLTVASADSTRIRNVDLARLEQRATDQFERVEKEKLRIAGEIFPADLVES